MGEVNSIYTSGEYLKHNPEWGRDDSLWKVKHIFNVLPDNFIEENFKGREISIADIGCGRGGIIGYFTAMLKEKSCRVNRSVGFDISDIPLKMARDEWKDVEFRKGRVEDLKENFDFCLLIDIVEHVENPDEFLRTCAVHCKYLILHIPLDDHYNTRLRNLRPYLAKTLGHIHYFNADSALGIVKRNGMKVLNYIYTSGFMLPSSRRRFIAQLGLIPKFFLHLISKSLCARILGGHSLMILAESQSYKGTNK